MLLTLLSALSGGALRLLPEIIGFFQKKEDNRHELNMLDKQIQYEQLRGANRAAEQVQEAAMQEQHDESAEHMAALHDQFQLLSDKLHGTGFKMLDGVAALIAVCVDALNMLVRPSGFYYLATLYGLYKAALLHVAMQQADVWHAVLQVYTIDDFNAFLGVLMFYYTGRVFDKLRK